MIIHFNGKVKGQKGMIHTLFLKQSVTCRILLETSVMLMMTRTALATNSHSHMDDKLIVPDSYPFPCDDNINDNDDDICICFKSVTLEFF